MQPSTDVERHWDAAYGKGRAASWHQDKPTGSIALIETLAVPSSAAIVDVGGGASPFAAALVDRSYTDVTVLDVSRAGLALAEERMGDQAARVEWVHADLLTWQPTRRYDVWHDRAVFHFLTDEDDRLAYCRTLERAMAPTALVILATFASDGPEYCSGLPVRRYDALDLAEQLGTAWHLVQSTRELHLTPAGRLQPFTWVALHRVTH